MALPALKAPAASFGSGSWNPAPPRPWDAGAGCRAGSQDLVFLYIASV